MVARDRSEPKSMAVAMDRLWSARDEARAMGECGHQHYESLHISWPTVVESLLS